MDILGHQITEKLISSNYGRKWKNILNVNVSFLRKLETQEY